MSYSEDAADLGMLIISRMTYQEYVKFCQDAGRTPTSRQVFRRATATYQKTRSGL